MSRSPEETEDLMVAASLGVATPEEVADIERAAAMDPDLAKRLTDLRQTTVLLAEDVPTIEPRSRVRKRLLADVRRESGGAGERRRSPFWWLAPAIGGAAIAAAISIGVVTGLDSGGGDDVRQVPVEQVASQTVEGELVVPGEDVPSILRLSGLGELPDGFGYEVWRFRGSAVESAGFVEVDADGSGVLAIPDLASAERIAVTAEPLTNTAAPTGPVIAEVQI